VGRVGQEFQVGRSERKVGKVRWVRLVKLDGV
jgi:hypothetical protein